MGEPRQKNGSRVGLSALAEASLFGALSGVFLFLLLFVLTKPAREFSAPVRLVSISMFSVLLGMVFLAFVVSIRRRNQPRRS